MVENLPNMENVQAKLLAVTSSRSEKISRAVGVRTLSKIDLVASSGLLAPIAWGPLKVALTVAEVSNILHYVSHEIKLNRYSRMKKLSKG